MAKPVFLVPIGNLIEIKEKVKVLLEKPDLRKLMGTTGKERIKKLMEKATQR